MNISHYVCSALFALTYAVMTNVAEGGERDVRNHFLGLRIHKPILCRHQITLQTTSPRFEDELKSSETRHDDLL